MHAFLHHSHRFPLDLIRFSQSSLSPMTSSMVLPSISVKKCALGAPESCRSYRHLGFKNEIRRISRLNLGKSRVFMSVAVGSQTAVDDALFRDYKPSTAFLFPGQLIGYPPGHRLYKGKNNAPDQKSEGYKPQGVANMTSNEPTTVDNTAAKTSSGSMFTPEQFAKILQLLGRDAIPAIPTIPEVNMAGITAAPSQHLNSRWIIDNGANDHMVGKHVHLHNSRSCVNTNGSVKLPNGSRTSVTALGPVDVTDKLALHDVLHIPIFDSNLLSVSKFTIEHHRTITFSPHFCLLSGPIEWEDNGDW